jgi:hypothetical protein
MIEITLLESSVGPLTKRIHLSPEGKLISDGSACIMSRGEARRMVLPDIEAFAYLITNLQTNQAIALGALRPGLPNVVQVTTKASLNMLNGSAPPDLISRTSEYIDFLPNRPAFVLLDVDTKGMPPNVASRVEECGGFKGALASVIPALIDSDAIYRSSTSACLSRYDTGEVVPGSKGLHVFVHVQDGADVERFLRTFHDRCWLAGFGWLIVGVGGQLLERSLIDRMVYAPERLVFEAAPILDHPLKQDSLGRSPQVCKGAQADTRAICPELSLGEQARLKGLKATERVRLATQADAARQAFIVRQGASIVDKTGCTESVARKIVQHQTAGTLLPPVVLPFDAEELACATVGDVLADPARFIGETLADPVEGIEYGRGKAKVMRRADGSLWIHSFAHGRTTYELRYDAASIRGLIEVAAAADVADLFVKLLLQAELAPEEEQQLRDLVKNLTGIKARALDAKIKAARISSSNEQIEIESDRRAAARDGKRLRIEQPQHDGERLPVLRMLDEALGASRLPVPPIRDLDGHPVEVRCRPPALLHELTSQGANQDEPPKTPLPAPVLPILQRHNRYSMEHEIEQHIEFVVETKDGDVRSVAIHDNYIEHYLAFRDSKLPRVGAIVTAPLVLSDGTLLAPEGLDRGRKTVFLIEPALMSLMPDPRQCTKSAAAEALHFLASEWLCDVATDFAGKCVLITHAITILERVLLPERPGFFLTAGRRGGGKTTALMMVILAATGRKPAAAAWSPNEEERRKAIFSYLAEGLAAMVWDNIPLGTTIACPTLEKVLTAESLSDRVLGKSRTLTVPAFTVMGFTGNNIAPRGDMASRCLMVRLEVMRPDPENRPFTHTDPVAWTLENRGAILRALYTILLATPQLRPETRVQAKTRFKTWYNLVAIPMEFAAAALVERQSILPEEDRYASQIDFVKLFAVVEDEDEDGMEMAQVLDILNAAFPSGKDFVASDVAELIRNPLLGQGPLASILRAFFDEHGRRGTGDLGAKVIGHRLSKMIGAPVAFGDKVMRLDRFQPKNQKEQRKVQIFSVSVL